MKYLSWLLKAAIFFTLFAFALNNEQDVTLNFFFGTAWRAPLVLVVLAVFTAGVVVGVLGMVPRWWRQRRVVRQLRPPVVDAPAAPAPGGRNPTAASAPPSTYGI